MKKFLFNTLFISLLSLACLFGGCEEPAEEVITPAFPEKVSATVAAGEQFEFTIAPNMPWTMKIPTEATTHFKFIKGESELYTLRGNAGEHQIVVAVSDIEEFDTVRVCEIEMTMGEETHVVAVLTRGGKERSLDIYVAEYDTTEGTFVTDTDNKYVYSTTAAGSIEWVWSNEQWMQRLMVDANFGWELGDNTPAWLLLNKTKGRAGQTELFLRVNKEALPLEDVECNIDFCDKSNEENIQIVKSYKTTMEGCKDVCEVELVSEALFNAAGEYYLSSSEAYVEMLNGSIYSPRGAEIYAVNKGEDGSYSTTGAEWITLTISDFPKEAGENGVWKRELGITVEAYEESTPREGAIVALPKPVAEAGGANLEDYIVCAITQEGVEVIDTSEPIVAYDEDMMMAYASRFERLEAGTWPWNGAWTSIPYAYKLTYRDNNSGSEVVFNRPFSRYVVYGYNGLSSGKYDNETCWVTIEEKNLTDNNGEPVENAYYFRSRLGTKEGEFEDTLSGGAGNNRAIFIFYDENDSPYALVYFVLDPNFSPYEQVEGEVMFVDFESALRGGASLTQLKSGDDYYSDEDGYNGTLQYLLTISSKNKTVELTVPEYQLAWSYKSWISIPELDENTTSSTSATITIVPEYLPTAPNEDIIAEGEYKGLISFYASMSNYKLGLQLHIIYKE